MAIKVGRCHVVAAMNHETARFGDLIFANPAMSAGAHRRAAVKRLPAVVAAAAFPLARPGAPISPTGRRIVLAVATFAANGMRLLARIPERTLLFGSQSVSRDVFNFATIRSAEGLN